MPDIETDKYQFNGIIHVTRNPIEVVRSMVGIKFFSNRGNEFTKFAYKHQPSLNKKNTDIEKAVEFWVKWNRRCALVADETMQLEHLDYERLSELLQHDIKPKPELDTKYNHRKRQDVPESEIRRLLHGREAEFGY